MPHLFYWACGAVAVIMAVYLLCRRQTLRDLLWGCGTGLTALFLLHHFGVTIGCAPLLNPFTLGTAAVLGVPGVLLVALLQ